MGSSIEISIGDSIGSSIGSSIGISIGCIIESIIRSNVGNSLGRSIGNSVESSIGISMGSKKIVISFLYFRILGKGLLIRFFWQQYSMSFFCKFSRLWIVTLYILRKILNSNTHKL